MQCDVKISFATGHAFACIHSISFDPYLLEICSKIRPINLYDISKIIFIIIYCIL